MFHFTRPGSPAIERFLESTSSSSFSYSHLGYTKPEKRGQIPPEYVIDNNRVVIGKGRADFDRAKDAIRNWKMFDFPWIELYCTTTPIEENRTVAILIRHFGVYSLNAARIVYVVDERDQFGFAYGTLAEHGEIGEERFAVNFDQVTGDVSYDLFAFSRPNHFLAKLGYPLVRRLQKQFAKDSKTAMLRAIQA